MSRIARSLIAQQVSTLSELERIASEQNWSSEELRLTIEERFGSSLADVSRFESYISNLLHTGWEANSVEFVKRNVVNCADVLFSKDSSIPVDRGCGYGLVVGRIQSGKTAHMLGLSARLLDGDSVNNWRPCDLVIILSGLIEDLRIQTLKRAKNSSIHSVSVFPDVDFKPSDTTSKLELRRALESRAGLMVIKKNHEILEELNQFLMSDEIEDIMLERRVVIIDDESDHASIDSGHAEAGEADEITRTNRAVRGIIQSCSIGSEKCWYIGYTATPYSNLLMHTNPEFAQIRSYGRTLFPRDFIYCIDAQPEGHMDNETLFYGGLNNAIKRQETPDANSLEEDQLLEDLVFLHVVSRIIRSSTENGIFHHTTMIHASRNVDDHLSVSDFMNSKIEVLLARTTAELEESALSIVREYYEDFLEVYTQNLIPIDDYSESRIKDELVAISIIKLNSDIQQDTDAFSYPSELNYPRNESKSFIVVGGQKLSRGLTLEGLVISWLARTSQQPKYDTMLQMARWCGFREPFEQMIRIFMPQDTIEHYSHITEVEIRLRDDLYELGPYANPLDELHWIREYNGMIISGKVPDSVRRRTSGGGLVPSDYYTMNLAEEYAPHASNQIQQNRIDSLIDLELEFDSAPTAAEGYDVFRDVTAFAISDFLLQYASNYPENSEQVTQLELIIDSCNTHFDTSWNVSVCQNRQSRFGYRNNGRLHLRQGRRRLSLIDLEDGRMNRESPMLLIHSEDPLTQNAGIPVYSNNGIPIVHIAVFLPDDMAPAEFYEVSRPVEEE